MYSDRFQLKVITTPAASDGQAAGVTFLPPMRQPKRHRARLSAPPADFLVPAARLLVAAIGIGAFLALIMT